MRTLLLLLEGPLQSWGGSDSRLDTRETGAVPTFSGVAGIVAAALGRHRSESLEDIAALSFAVRTERRGIITRDFQTRNRHDGEDKPYEARIYRRSYLNNAAFLAALSGEKGFITEIANALKQPVFALFLGRKSCTPSEPIFYRLTDHSNPIDALSSEPTIHGEIEQELHITAAPGEPYDRTEQDTPVSFDSYRRSHGARRIAVRIIQVPTEEKPESGPEPRSKDM
ncbi:MAG: type I-E CRISPR-associated protein Cas5/CasD [Candidatus Lumbricidophila eiseniae]|uniref:Type I-E CRISPR-associated protein Cas5/CasD n=1 Tax=Candidatus Lumbricidiphila eiseniae TaxID=1969409 RepID=A0A2A6FRC6_9MICO|nr:MAG: type I-E CRISPR-associated protein Cas5/CasD [Candidatus Lumbricidophila eiseniae]